VVFGAIATHIWRERVAKSLIAAIRARSVRAAYRR